MTISARNWAWDVNNYRAGDGTRIDMKPGEKLTLLCLAENENAEYGHSFPSHDYIAKRTGQSVRTVQNHLKTLKACNAFKLEKRRSQSGKWLRNVYVLQVPDSYRLKDPEWQRWNE